MKQASKCYDLTDTVKDVNEKKKTGLQEYKKNIKTRVFIVIMIFENM